MAGADASAITGLRAAESLMTTVGDNVANSVTDGYKKLDCRFSSVVAGSNNPNSFSAGGVRAKPLRLANEQGLLRATNSATDLAISGNGFLVIGKNAEVAAGASNEFAFTRAGSFLPDKQGYLRNTAGFYLQGWKTGTNGVPTAADLNSLTNLETIRVNTIAGISTPTTQVTLKLNLPENKAGGGTERTAMEIYDSLGEPHALSFLWTKVAPANPGDPITWNLTVTAVGGTVTQNTGLGAAYTNIPIVFDGEGKPTTFGGNPNPPQIFIDWGNAALDSTVALDLGTAGQSNGVTSRYGDYAETLVDQNGKAVGQLTGLEVNEEGIVSALFSNGQALKIYKVPLANFASPHQLASKDGNVWGQTDLSGNYLLAAAKSAGMGSLKSNALEQSTVELASEFTRMMEAQRFYSGNIKVIQTTEEMFAKLEQLKR